MLRAVIAAGLVGLFACANDRHEPLRIGLQPFGEVPTAWMDSLADALTHEHDAHVYQLGSVELPASAFTQVKSARYRADSLLHALIRMKPDTIDLIIGITRRDISTTKRGVNGEVLEPASRYADWGVFGLGYQPGHASIISSFRLGEGHALFIQRLRKVAVHEAGHNRGLPHCPNSGCVMADAVEHLSHIDGESPGLCEQCRRLLR